MTVAVASTTAVNSYHLLCHILVSSLRKIEKH